MMVNQNKSMKSNNRKNNRRPIGKRDRESRGTDGSNPCKERSRKKKNMKIMDTREKNRNE